MLEKIKEERDKIIADSECSQHMKNMANLIWLRLDKYFRKCDETPIYYVAIYLHPQQGPEWFDELVERLRRLEI